MLNISYCFLSSYFFSISLINTSRCNVKNEIQTIFLHLDVVAY